MKRRSASDLAVKNRKPVHTDSYAVDMIRQQVDEIVGKDRAIADGYQIYTTIDPDLQKRAEQSLRAHLEDTENHPGYTHQTFAQYAEILRQRRAERRCGRQGAARARLFAGLRGRAG